VPLLPRVNRWHVPRFVAWLFGLMLYGCASGLKILALNLGPLTVLASVFSTLIIFNLVFAHLLLREPITRGKVAGCLVVLLGAVVVGVGAPDDTPTKFTPAEIEAFLDSGGLTFLGVCLGIVALSVCSITAYEVRYYGSSCSCCARGKGKGAGGATEDAVAQTETPVASPDSSPIARRARTDAPKQPQRELPQPPWCLAAAMVLIYPGGLGLDEAVADCGIRAFTSMLASGEPVEGRAFWLMASTGVCCAIATSVWLAVVYRRYETTVALPIEYGALNVASVLAGLLFYDEYQYMDDWQLALALAGVCIIVAGIIVGLIATAPDTVAARLSLSALQRPNIGIKGTATPATQHTSSTAMGSPPPPPNPISSPAVHAFVSGLARVPSFERSRDRSRAKGQHRRLPSVDSVVAANDAGDTPHVIPVQAPAGRV